jgi:hypothetical protein
MAKLPDAMSLSRTLGACADELAALAALSQQLQTDLSPALQTLSAVEDAQALDLLTQSLGAIADYLIDLAAGLPPDWLIDPRDAVARVSLAEMARRLAGAHASDGQDSGELELFGGAS